MPAILWPTGVHDPNEAIKQAYYSVEVTHWNNVLSGAKTDPYVYPELGIDIRVCYNIN